MIDLQSGQTDFDIFYLVSYDGGITWSENGTVNPSDTSTDNDIFPVVAIDEQAHFIVCWFYYSGNDSSSGHLHCSITDDVLNWPPSYLESATSIENLSGFPISVISFGANQFLAGSIVNGVPTIFNISGGYMQVGSSIITRNASKFQLGTGGTRKNIIGVWERVRFSQFEIL